MFLLLHIKAMFLEMKVLLIIGQYFSGVPKAKPRTSDIAAAIPPPKSEKSCFSQSSTGTAAFENGHEIEFSIFL